MGGTLTTGPLVCEFVGLPGAGKTTVAATVVRALAQRTDCPRCADRRSLGRSGSAGLPPVIRRLRFHAMHGAPLRAALRAGLSVRPRAWAALAHSVEAAHWAYALRPDRVKDFDVVILDQGIVQELWSAAVRARHWDDRAFGTALRRIMGAQGRPPALVYFDIPAAVAAQRIHRRAGGGSRFDRVAPAAAAILLEDESACLERIFERAVAATGAPSHRVDGSLTPEAIGADVVRFLAGIA